MARIAGKTSLGVKPSAKNGDALLSLIKQKTTSITPSARKTSINGENRPEDMLTTSEEVNQVGNGQNNTQDGINSNNDVSFEELKNLFGIGFSGLDYQEMYSKYISLQNNYPLRTEMHKEALITYIKYAYKRDKAIADDDMEAADKWGKLAAKQATDAKINPSQLSAADLSDGMTCFSQVSAAVERAQDIIPLLNKFIDKPQDRVDYTIWQYVNYCRHLEGKPLIQYKDLYTFLKKRYEENKDKLSFIYDEGDGLFDTNDLGD